MQTDVTLRQTPRARRIQSSVSSSLQQRPRAEAAGNHQEVDLRRVGETVLRDHLQAAGGDDRPRGARRR